MVVFKNRHVSLFKKLEIFELVVFAQVIFFHSFIIMVSKTQNKNDKSAVKKLHKSHKN